MSLPVPNLDDRTFQELFEEARSLIPRYAPEWTDHNFSDPGITFIDLFAWLTELQIYALNRRNDRNYLKFLALLGEAPMPAKAAKVDLTFTLAGTTEPVDVPARSQVAAANPTTGEPLIFETDEPVTVSAISLERVLTLVPGPATDPSAVRMDVAPCNGTLEVVGPCEEVASLGPGRNERPASKVILLRDDTATNARNGVFYHPFGEPLSDEARFCLGFEAKGSFPKVTIMLKINAFEEADMPPVPGRADGKRAAIIPSADLEWQYWNGTDWRRLDLKEDDTAALTRSGKIAFDGPADIVAARITDIEKSVRTTDEPPLYWIGVRIKHQEYEIPPRIDSILVNTISATHAKTVSEEHEIEDELPYKEITLNEKPVLRQGLRLEVKGKDWLKWTPVPDFDASGSEDTHYTIDLEKGIVAFGDGIQGKIPPLANELLGLIRVTYRTGGGEIGNVAANTINRILSPELSLVRVENLHPASGGANAEPLETAKIWVRRAARSATRCVTSEDYDCLARMTPGLRVARTRVLPEYHPDFPCLKMPGCVTIVVLPYALPGAPSGPKMPGKAFCKTIENYLKPRCLVTTDLHVIPPTYSRIDVTAEIRIDPRSQAETVRTSVGDALSEFLDPVKGGTDKKGWPFGRAVYKSEIYEAIGKVPGVCCVESVSLTADKCFRIDGGNIRIARVGLVYSGTHKVTIV
jgi:predicted phage baseplate assembly protein